MLELDFIGNKVENIKIAYIGGGSRGWAWGLMSDLVSVGDISGEVFLYDVDYDAAKRNETIGNKFNDAEGAVSKWNYKAVPFIGDALSGADFVIISILPGTFDEMQSDVHTPEKYGIYQTVGDTSGPGGIIRALRTIPMFEEIAAAIKKFCPTAWVINYTNPMTVSIRTLYRVFPQIKAFGCCHEVFGTQKLLAGALAEFEGIDGATRHEIIINVLGINHFTWITKAQYKNIDLFPVYERFCEKYAETGYRKNSDDNWLNRFFVSGEKVKMDLFKRYGVIAAAGDRHLAEFCERSWYLESPECAEKWGFALTPVSWRKENLADRLEKSKKLASGEEPCKISNTGEEGVNQIRAILGLCELTTNVNLPNRGQIPNLSYDAVVETNASFRAGSVTPLQAGEIPASIYHLVAGAVGRQEEVVEAGISRDVHKAFCAFLSDPLVGLPVDKARELFNEMTENTKKYLTMYDKIHV